jgi:hypothetical protein
LENSSRHRAILCPKNGDRIEEGESYDSWLAGKVFWFQFNWDFVVCSHTATPQWRLYDQNGDFSGYNPGMIYRPKIMEKCQKLVNSMPNRIYQVIENDGGHIMY